MKALASSTLLRGLSGLAAAGSAAKHPYQAFDVQPTLRSENGKLDVRLEIGVALYENNATGFMQNLVGYNGVVGGPTLYVKPGDQVSITLVNQLPKEPVNTFVPELFNEYHAVDITNLHFHGLHIAERDHPNALEIRVGEEVSQAVASVQLD